MDVHFHYRSKKNRESPFKAIIMCSKLIYYNDTICARELNVADHTEMTVPSIFITMAIQIGAKNWATGHPISLQIFRKLHDRIAWKLVDFCNIIY